MPCIAVYCPLSFPGSALWLILMGPGERKKRKKEDFWLVHLARPRKQERGGKKSGTSFLCSFVLRGWVVARSKLICQVTGNLASSFFLPFFLPSFKAHQIRSRVPSLLSSSSPFALQPPSTCNKWRVEAFGRLKQDDPPTFTATIPLLVLPH